MESSTIQDFSCLQDSRVSDFFALLKPRVMSLVVFSGFTGMWVAPGFSQMNFVLIIVAILCLAVNAGAAGAINMWYDRDIDVVMKRTRGRPIPTGRIQPAEALSFGVTLSLFSVILMGLALNWVAAGILAFANLFYVIIYTVCLKRTTPQNIVIGGAAGAFPPLVGWASVSGDIGIEAAILFAIIFFWTPPHFWALSIYANEDYKRAGIPMMAVVSGVDYTKKLMLFYTLVLFPITLLPWLLGFATLIYGISAIVLSGFFVIAAVNVLKSSDNKFARLMFSYSIFYLFALFLSVIFNAT